MTNDEVDQLARNIAAGLCFAPPSGLALGIRLVAVLDRIRTLERAIRRANKRYGDAIHEEPCLELEGLLEQLDDASGIGG